MHSRIFAALLVLFLWQAAVQSRVYACVIPVYEYALLNWAADQYGVLVFHEGDLGREAQEAIAELERSPAGPIVRLADLEADLDEAVRRLWAGQEAASLPWMVISQPSPPGRERVAWAGSLNLENVRMVLDSPMRGKIARRILLGDVAVWILVGGGDQKENEAAEEVLESVLSRFSENEKPDDTAVRDLPGRSDGKPVNFSMLRVARDEREERFLIDQLLDIEPDLRALAERKAVPMAFPVFGRGRALYALVGRGINAGNILEACAFLLGNCSCLVKAANPGSDLLMAVDWQGRLEGVPITDTALAQVERRERIPAVEALPAAGGGRWWRGGLIGLAAGLAAVGLAGWLALRRPGTT